MLSTNNYLLNSANFKSAIYVVKDKDDVIKIDFNDFHSNKMSFVFSTLLDSYAYLKGNSFLSVLFFHY